MIFCVIAMSAVLGLKCQHTARESTDVYTLNFTLCSHVIAQLSPAFLTLVGRVCYIFQVI